MAKAAAMAWRSGNSEAKSGKTKQQHQKNGGSIMAAGMAAWRSIKAKKNHQRKRHRRNGGVISAYGGSIIISVVSWPYQQRDNGVA